jgi:serine protease AprX
VLKRLWIVILVLVVNGLILNAQNSKATTKLDNALIHVPADETIKVWIHFTDKGDNINLDLVKNNFTEKSKVRRAKVMEDEIVDQYDVPINSQYLNIVKSHVKRIVVKSKWLNAVSALVTQKNIGELSNLEFVRLIDTVKKFKRNQPIDEGITQQSVNIENTFSFDYGNSFTQNNQINVPALHDLGIVGSGVLICVLDNNFNLIDHETFSSMNILSTWDFINNDSTVNDAGEGTHGTQTLSTVGGWSPGNLIGPAFGADYILGKTEVSSFEQPIEEDYWVEGAEWADSLGADVLSSSLGYLDWYTWQDMDGNTAVTTIAADIAVSRGIVVVNSAGNEGTGTNNTLIAPADGDSVIAVAAVTSSGSRSSFSSIGPSADGRTKPDIAAMGSSVTVASTSNTAGYTTSSGTSFSCPLTSGVAALVLSVNPNLTPMQVRDALRETASQASTPDNELGWGILNAYDAAFYYNSVFTHEPLSDNEDLTGPYNVVSIIDSRLPLVASEIKLVYGTDTNFGNEVVMQSTGTTDEYSAQIPGTGSPSEFYYYITTTNNQQITSTFPFGAPTEYFRFYAGPDSVSPVISHSALYNQALSRWPAEIIATATDNLGIDSVWVEFRINSGSFQNFDLSSGLINSFSGLFPVLASSVNAGDLVEYRIYAKDNSTSPNISQLPGTGYFGFNIIDALGLAVVIDDDQTIESTKDGKPGLTRSIEKLGLAANRFERVLQQMGYLVDNVSSTLIDTSMLSQYDLIISSSGSETAPVSSGNLRTKLEDWVTANPDNKLLIEGGEVGYDAISSPGYPSFATNVLHGLDWHGDSSGDLVLTSNQLTHPIVTNPNILPSNISINYSDWGDEDAIEPTGDAYTIYETQDDPGSGGVIIYDDDSDTTNAQIAFFAFNIDAISDTTVANNLIENTVSYLMHDPTVTSTPDISDNLPLSFDLMQNYPNPFNPQTTIEFSIPNISEIELVVFNLLGQNVFQNNMKNVNAGIYKIHFDGNGLSIGIYFDSLKVTEESGKIYNQTRKMLFIQ